MSINGSTLVLSPSRTLEYSKWYILTIPIMYISDVYGNQLKSIINLRFLTSPKPEPIKPTNTPKTTPTPTSTASPTIIPTHKLSLKTESYQYQTLSGNDAGTCVFIDSFGYVWQYGYDIATKKYIKTPVKVSNITDAIEVDVGNLGNIVALRKDGSVWMWGKIYDTKSGDFKYSDIPIQMKPANKEILHVRSNNIMNMFNYLTSDGHVFEVDNNYSELAVNGLTDVIRIEQSNLFNAALTSDGSVYVWSKSNNYDSYALTKITISDIKFISLDDFSTLLMVDKQGLSWRINIDRVGNLSSKPEMIKNTENTTIIVEGFWALKTDGTIWEYNYNNDNKLEFMQDKIDNNIINITSLNIDLIYEKLDGTIWICHVNDNNGKGSIERIF